MFAATYLLLQAGATTAVAGSIAKCDVEPYRQDAQLIDPDTSEAWKQSPAMPFRASAVPVLSLARRGLINQPSPRRTSKT